MGEGRPRTLRDPGLLADHLAERGRDLKAGMVVDYR